MLIFFFKINFSNNSLSNTSRELNSLDPSQARQNVRYDMHTLIGFFTVILTIYKCDKQNFSLRRFEKKVFEILIHLLNFTILLHQAFANYSRVILVSPEKS